MAGSPLCCVCGRPETVDHIFFSGCIFSQYLWCGIRDAFGWHDLPVSKNDLLCEWLPRRLGVSQRLVLFFYADLAWAIQKNRNKMAIERTFPSNPDAVIYAAINSLQMWGDLLKDADKALVMKMVACIQE